MFAQPHTRAAAVLVDEFNASHFQSTPNCQVIGRRHGRLAVGQLGPADGGNAYQAFEAAVIADYDAESAVERELVLRLASVLWRLRRATGIETALLESATTEPGKLENGCSRLTVVGGVDLPEQDQLGMGALRQSDAAAANELSLNTKKDIGNCFLRLAELPTFPLDRVNRYEHLIWRQARQIVCTLESLRRRKSQSVRSTFPFSFR
jgi:hypothetical protein